MSAPLTAVCVLGCSSSAGASHELDTPPVTVGTFDAGVMDSGSSSDGSSDGPPNHIKPFQGSPLCNALLWTGCYPDEPKTANAQECNLELDGGTYMGSGSDKTQLACHVERTDGGAGIKPVCTLPGPGADGDPCNVGLDCGPGLECVADGTCRPYCCAGSCTDSTEFCDIQMTTDTRLRVPVCMPIHPCSLLNLSSDAGTCDYGETCALANDYGATTCVAIGPQKVGEGCDTEHCGRYLTCLGSAGDRNCFALCRTMTRSTGCAPNQVCSGSFPLLPDPNVGLCR